MRAISRAAGTTCRLVPILERFRGAAHTFNLFTLVSPRRDSKGLVKVVRTADDTVPVNADAHAHQGSVDAIKRSEHMKGILAWLIGIPIPIIILLWLFGVF